jgi:hypothetical protein
MIFDKFTTLYRGTSVMSLPTEVRVFSDVFRSRKTQIAHFTSHFLSNYRLKLYRIQARTIEEAGLSLESPQT